MRMIKSLSSFGIDNSTEIRHDVNNIGCISKNLITFVFITLSNKTDADNDNDYMDISLMRQRKLLKIIHHTRKKSKYNRRSCKRTFRFLYKHTQEKPYFKLTENTQSSYSHSNKKYFIL